MTKPRIATAVLLIPAALIAAACSRPPEQQLLTQFFRAAKARDNATTSRMSAVEIDPRDQGSIEDFSIVSVGDEGRQPLDFKPLLEAEEKAKSEETAFLKTKVEYQIANIKTIEEVLKLERDPQARMTPLQTKVKAEWDTWRAGINSHQKDVSMARAALLAATGAAEASLTQPGQPALDPKAFAGETVTKDVVVSARLRTPDGASVEKTLTITFTRVVGTMAGAPREGRPIITKIAGL